MNTAPWLPSQNQTPNYYPPPVNTNNLFNQNSNFTSIPNQKSEGNMGEDQNKLVNLQMQAQQWQQQKQYQDWLNQQQSMHSLSTGTNANNSFGNSLQGQPGAHGNMYPQNLISPIIQQPMNNAPTSQHNLELAKSIKEKTEELALVLKEESEFDKQYTDWEKQFDQWKEQNKNHPNKEQFKQYEEQWNTWKSQMNAKREEIISKKTKIQGALHDLKAKEMAMIMPTPPPTNNMPMMQQPYMMNTPVPIGINPAPPPPTNLAPPPVPYGNTSIGMYPSSMNYAPSMGLGGMMVNLPAGSSGMPGNLPGMMNQIGMMNPNPGRIYGNPSNDFNQSPYMGPNVTSQSFNMNPNNNMVNAYHNFGNIPGNSNADSSIMGIMNPYGFNNGMGYNPRIMQQVPGGFNSSVMGPPGMMAGRGFSTMTNDISFINSNAEEGMKYNDGKTPTSEPYNNGLAASLSPLKGTCIGGFNYNPNPTIYNGSGASTATDDFDRRSDQPTSRSVCKNEHGSGEDDKHRSGRSRNFYRNHEDQRKMPYNREVSHDIRNNDRHNSRDAGEERRRDDSNNYRARDREHGSDRNYNRENREAMDSSVGGQHTNEKLSSSPSESLPTERKRTSRWGKPEDVQSAASHPSSAFVNKDIDTKKPHLPITSPSKISAINKLRSEPTSITSLMGSPPSLLSGVNSQPENIKKLFPFGGARPPFPANIGAMPPLLGQHPPDRPSYNNLQPLMGASLNDQQNQDLDSGENNDSDGTGNHLVPSCGNEVPPFPMGPRHPMLSNASPQQLAAMRMMFMFRMRGMMRGGVPGGAPLPFPPPFGGRSGPRFGAGGPRFPFVGGGHGDRLRRGLWKGARGRGGYPTFDGGRNRYGNYGSNNLDRNRSRSPCTRNNEQTESGNNQDNFFFWGNEAPNRKMGEELWDEEHAARGYENQFSVPNSAETLNVDGTKFTHEAEP